MTCYLGDQLKARVEQMPMSEAQTVLLYGYRTDWRGEGCRLYIDAMPTEDLREALFVVLQFLSDMCSEAERAKQMARWPVYDRTGAIDPYPDNSVDVGQRK